MEFLQTILTISFFNLVLYSINFRIQIQKSVQVYMKVSIIFDQTVKAQQKQYCVRILKAAIHNIKSKYSKLLDNNRHADQSHHTLIPKFNSNQRTCIHNLSNVNEQDKLQYTFRQGNKTADYIFKNITNLKSSVKDVKERHTNKKLRPENQKRLLQNTCPRIQLQKYSQQSEIQNINFDFHKQSIGKKVKQQLIYGQDKNKQLKISSCHYNFLYEEKLSNAFQTQITKSFKKQQINQQSMNYMQKIQRKIDQQIIYYKSILQKLDLLEYRLIYFQQKINRSTPNRKTEQFTNDFDKSKFSRLCEQTKMLSSIQQAATIPIQRFRADLNLSNIQTAAQIFNDKFSLLQNMYRGIICNSFFNNDKPQKKDKTQE